MKSIKRQALREQVYQGILQEIVAGRFSAGVRIKDTDIAARQGISRTPAREALLRLESDGFLINSVGRGFAVRPLDANEIRELYPILIDLEALALRSSPPADAKRIAKLRALNTEIGAPKTAPLKRIARDIVWHNTLISGCDNQTLLSMIEVLMQRIQRYLHAYIMLMPRIETSIDHHEEIAVSLESGDVEGSISILAEHWQRNLAILLELLNYGDPSQP